MDKELKELIVFLRNYQLWRRGADIEQPDPTELGDRLDEAIQLLSERWREIRDVDAIEAERDKYKKALEDLRDWVKHEEEIERFLAKGCSYFNVLEKIEGILEL